MAKSITKDDIKRINMEYLDCHTYAEVARRTGFSPSTVKKYIIPNFQPIDEKHIRRFDYNRDMPQDEKWLEMFNTSADWGALCDYLDDEEFDSIVGLWKEIEL